MYLPLSPFLPEEKPPKRDRPLSAKQDMDRSLKGPSYRPISASRQVSGTKSGSLTRTKSFRQHSGSRSLARLRPRHISMDKEQLYEETLSLKMEVNFFKEQNVRLKTRLQQTEKELGKKEEFLDEIHMNAKEHTGVANSHLVGNLKHSIKELKIELKQREDDIEKLKRDTKVSRVNELEIELQAYIDECTRLRHHTEELMLQLQQRSSNLKDLSKAEEAMRTLTAQKTTLEIKLKHTQDELNKANEMVAGLEGKVKEMNSADVRNLKAEVRKLKHQLEQMEELVKKGKTAEGENQTIKRDCESLKNRLAASETEKRKLEAEIADLQAKLQEVQKPTLPGPIIDDSKYEISVKEEAKAETSYEEEKAIIEEIEKSTRNSTRAFAAKCVESLITASTSDIHALRYLLTTAHPSVTDLVAALQAVGVNTNGTEVQAHVEHLSEWLLPQLPADPEIIAKSTGKTSENESNSQYSSEYEEEENETSPVKKPGIKVPNMRLSDVFHSPKSTSIAYIDPSLKLISYRLQLHRISKSKLGEALFGTDLHTPVTPESLKNLLLSPPLSINNESECEEIVTYILEKCGEVHSAKELIRGLLTVLDDWEVMTDEEEAKFDQHISHVMTRKRDEFLDLCSEHDPSHTGEIPLSVLNDIFQRLQIDFSPKEFHYIELLFFSLNFQLNLAPYEKLVEAYAMDDSQFSGTDRSEITLTDEERRGVVKKYLDTIATQLMAKSLDLSQVFRSKDGYLYPDKFVQGLRTLGIPDMRKEELVVFLDALQCEDLDEYGMDMQLFADVISGYQAHTKAPPNDKSLVELGSSSDSADSI